MEQGREQANYSFAEVKAQASRIAAFLQNDHGLVPGDAALIIIPPGQVRAKAADAPCLRVADRRACCLACVPAPQEFLFAFLGCIMAGVIAVPVYPPVSSSSRSRSSSGCYRGRLEGMTSSSSSSIDRPKLACDRLGRRPAHQPTTLPGLRLC